jgi:hypothetical protein
LKRKPFQMFHRYAQFQSFQTFNRVLSTSLRTGAQFIVGSVRSRRSKRSTASLRSKRFKSQRLAERKLILREPRNAGSAALLHWLFEDKKRFSLCVLDYMIRSNQS